MSLLKSTRITALVLAALSALTLGVARADTTVYMVNGSGAFGTIDLNTGAFSSLGAAGITLAGLGEVGGVVYGTNFLSGSGTLFTVNQANGGLTAVGNSGISYDDLGSTLTGLYALGQDANLYSIDPSTGAATLLGPTGIPNGGVQGMSDNSGTLYDAAGPDLYTLNTTTGAATLVGPIGGSGPSAYLGALITEGSTLYAGQDDPSAFVDTVDTTTGEASVGPALTGVSGKFWGLAQIPVAQASAPDSLPRWLGWAVIAALPLIWRRRGLAAS